MIQTIGLLVVSGIAGWAVANHRSFIVGLCIGTAWILGVSYGR